MARVVVTPERFTLVKFDAAAIARTVEGLADALGVPADDEVQVEVDEEGILAKTEVRSLDPIALWLQGGAVEDPKRPREVSEDRVVDAVGLLLVEALDRRSSDFGAPPLGDELELPVLVAWQVHAAARLGAVAGRDQRDRRLYHFRNRHGFTDVADRAFERLWSTEPLTFAQVQQLSDEARAAQPA